MYIIIKFLQKIGLTIKITSLYFFLFCDNVERINYKYELVSTNSSYSQPEIQRVGDFELDDIYEAKAHKWMLNSIDLKQKILFWCVGRRLTGDEVESICKR